MIIHLFDDYERSKIEQQAAVFGALIWRSQGQDVEAAFPAVERRAREIASRYYEPGASQDYLTEDVIPLVWSGFSRASDGAPINQ